MRSMSADDASWQPSHAIINSEFEVQSLVHLAPLLLQCHERSPDSFKCYVSVSCFFLLLVKTAAGSLKSVSAQSRKLLL
jgi:hypothetical protein